MKHPKYLFTCVIRLIHTLKKNGSIYKKNETQMLWMLKFEVFLHRDSQKKLCIIIVIKQKSKEERVGMFTCRYRKEVMTSARAFIHFTRACAKVRDSEK